ncbi:trypsin-like serine peptidase [Pseudomonas boanensis]|uniref:trypsin-like serine peptidase n=1 Tax=Metapseudomonas boanensis TaxID=2822138 RepID=UPI0035D481A3
MAKPAIDPLLLSTVLIRTFNGEQGLTNATGFLFTRGERLFLVTSGHVLFDEPSGHFPSHLTVELHTSAENLAEVTQVWIPLYCEGKGLWHQATDSSGQVDVATLELDRSLLPASALYRPFSEHQLLKPGDQVEVGTSLLVIGYPLGFHDALHRTPVVRHGIVASAFGLRFHGKGYFLVDARTHRGSSGAPVVMRATAPFEADFPWILLGVHSARLDEGSRDALQDEALGLNAVWYADILMLLSQG